MQKSEQIGELVGALAKARTAFRTIGKDKTAKIVSQKGSFSYTYADFATVQDATAPALAANGLAVMQPVRLVKGDPDQIVVTTILAHSSGQWISEEMSWPVAATDNRSIGSGVTYARRHSYLAIVGAASTDEDDDAEQARGGAHEMAQPTHADSVKAKVAAQNGKQDPISAFKFEALREATMLLGDDDHAKAWFREIRQDPKGARPWDDKDVEKIKAALAQMRAQLNNEAGRN
jgi:hypothetical protein